jgi:hypothetical protein
LGLEVIGKGVHDDPDERHLMGMWVSWWGGGIGKGVCRFDDWNGGWRGLGYVGRGMWRARVVGMISQGRRAKCFSGANLGQFWYVGREALCEKGVGKAVAYWADGAAESLSGNVTCP